MHKKISFLLAMTAAFALALPHTVPADSQCTGKSRSECERADDCTWVSGYTTQAGVSVDAYCRAKPGRANDRASVRN